MITVAIINESTVVSDEQLAPLVAALQIQVSQHFAPVWGTDARLVQVLKGRTPPAGAWWLVISNTSDYAGAAGYHDVTPEGLPLGKAFIKDDVDAGRHWTTTPSHELLEMLADPDISDCIEVDTGNSSVFWAKEICDPCEDDACAYFIGQVLVSDFVLPGFYHRYRNYPFFDYNKRITQPFQILPGGYASFYDPSSNAGWRDLGPDSKPPTDPHARARVGSRRERRAIPRQQWQKSTASPGLSADATKEKV